MSNSMYRGVLIDKENRTNYTNYESADITGLTVTGTGGPAPRRRTSPKLRSKSTPPERGWKTCSSTVARTLAFACTSPTLPRRFET